MQGKKNKEYPYCPHLNTVLYLNHYKRKEVIIYAQNKRQQKPSQN